MVQNNAIPHKIINFFRPNKHCYANEMMTKVFEMKLRKPHETFIGRYISQLYVISILKFVRYNNTGKTQQMLAVRHSYTRM